MTKKSTEKVYLSADLLKKIDLWIKKFPDDQKQSAVMAALMHVQDEYGYIDDEAMEEISQYLDMPLIAVCEVASFYTMYRLRPMGKNQIDICTNISCQLNGADLIVEAIEKELNVKLGETTPDGKFHFRKVECLGACAAAPVMQINKDYHENLQPEKLGAIFASYLTGDE